MALLRCEPFWRQIFSLLLLKIKIVKENNSYDTSWKNLQNLCPKFDFSHHTSSLSRISWRQAGNYSTTLKSRIQAGEEGNSDEAEGHTNPANLFDDSLNPDKRGIAKMQASLSTLEFLLPSLWPMNQTRGWHESRAKLHFLQQAQPHHPRRRLRTTRRCLSRAWCHHFGNLTPPKCTNGNRYRSLLVTWPPMAPKPTGSTVYPSHVV